MSNNIANTIQFTKMHGLGNDYIYVNCLTSELESPPIVAKLVSDRHFGIGGDGLVLIAPSNIADFRMRMFNADGSEAQNCGNAVRCIAKYVYDNKITANERITLETLAGILTLDLIIDAQSKTVHSVRVDMGTPILDPARIPLNVALTQSNQVTIIVDETTYTAFCVSMGNPHAVIFVDEITDTQVLSHGPLIENHPVFPERVNVEFVKVDSTEHLTMRVWERGSGETLACGTGASAVCVAGFALNKSARSVTIQLLGGSLQVEWDESSDNVFMTGPATTVFNGTVNLKNLLREKA